jgi:hypothetical protein
VVLKIDSDDFRQLELLQALVELVKRVDKGEWLLVHSAIHLALRRVIHVHPLCCWLGRQRQTQ